MSIMDLRPLGMVQKGDKGATGDTGAKGSTGATGTLAHISNGTQSYQATQLSWTSLNGFNDKEYRILGSAYAFASSGSVSPYFCLNFNNDWSARYHYIRAVDNNGAHTTYSSWADGACIFAAIPTGHQGHYMYNIDIIPQLYGSTHYNILYRWQDDNTGIIAVGQSAGEWVTSDTVSSIQITVANTTASTSIAGVLETYTNKSWA